MLKFFKKMGIGTEKLATSTFEQRLDKIKHESNLITLIARPYNNQIALFEALELYKKQKAVGKHEICSRLALEQRSLLEGLQRPTLFKYPKEMMSSSPVYMELEYQNVMWTICSIERVYSPEAWRALLSISKGAILFTSLVKSRSEEENQNLDISLSSILEERYAISEEWFWDLGLEEDLCFKPHREENGVHCVVQSAEDRNSLPVETSAILSTLSKEYTPVPIERYFRTYWDDLPSLFEPFDALVQLILEDEQSEY